VTGFAADTSGATSIEYALIATLIAVVIIGAVTNVGTSVNRMIVSAAAGLR
jgi:pilus assembly protein Flp/PilA